MHTRNVTEKGEFRAACAELGLIFVAPDTSPRGDDVPDDPSGAYVPALLVDQGEADSFLAEQLKPAFLARACTKAGIDLELKLHTGFDHSYYFISTFMTDHLRWHAKRLD